MKTSIKSPKELLQRLDRVNRNRSAVLEQAALADLSRLDRQTRDRRDLEIINANSKNLNHAAADTLEYQQLP